MFLRALYEIKDREGGYHDVKVILVALVVKPGNSICVTQVLVDLPLIWSSIGGAAFACLVLKLQCNLQTPLTA